MLVKLFSSKKVLFSLQFVFACFLTFCERRVRSEVGRLRNQWLALIVILLKDVRRGILTIPDVFVQIFNLLNQEELILLSQLVEVQVLHQLIDYFIPLFNALLVIVLRLLFIFHDTFEHVHGTAHLQVALPCSPRHTFADIIVSSYDVSYGDRRRNAITCCSFSDRLAFNAIMGSSGPGAGPDLRSSKRAFLR